MVVPRTPATLVSRGMDTLVKLHTARPDSHDAISHPTTTLGLDPTRLRLLLYIAARYLQSADIEENTKTREDTTALARRLRLSLDTYVLIDKRSRQANNIELHDSLCLTLATAAGRSGSGELDLYMRETLIELNIEDEPPQHLRTRFSRKVGIRGMRYFHISGPSDMLGNLLFPLTIHVVEIREPHPESSHDRCVDQALVERLEHADATMSVDRLDEMRYQPAIIITVQDIINYNPCFVVTINGSALTPDVSPNVLLADIRRAVPYDERSVITDLFLISSPRLTTEEQRIAMPIDNPICA